MPESLSIQQALGYAVIMIGIFFTIALALVRIIYKTVIERIQELSAKVDSIGGSWNTQKEEIIDITSRACAQRQAACQKLMKERYENEMERIRKLEAIRNGVLRGAANA